MKELFNLVGKTALVTGGGRGLGEQMVQALAEAGANIVICSRNLEACQAVVDQLTERGTQAIALACDVSDPAMIQQVVDKAVEHFGRIDILVNNSGISWAAPMLAMPVDKWDKVMNVNVRAVFLFAQAVAPIMMQNGGGKIINIASVSGFGGTHPALMDTIAYNTSKGAVMTLTKDLAVKLASRNIQVNAIAPGFFPTKITQKLQENTSEKLLAHIPARRFGGENDLGGSVIFLASSASNYVTGHVLVVDGGISALV